LRIRAQVIENWEDCAGSNNRLRLEANPARKEHLLQTLPYDLRMGAFHWFTRRQHTQPPTDLRKALIAAANTNNQRELLRLIDAYRETIRDAFPEWTSVPETIRNDPDALQQYAQTMFRVATVFERAGDTSLMTRLRGDEPTARWNAEINRAQSLLDQKRPTEAVTVLKTVLDGMAQMRGSIVDYYRPRVLGKLGIALLQSGDAREAVKVTREALELCRQAGDEDGVQTNTRNLENIGTYQMPANDGIDANVTVVYRDEHGSTLTLDELRVASGTVKWEVRGGAPVPADVKQTHDEGRAAGARGDYQAAASLFTKAAELAPTWPYPVYDLAFTRLMQHDFASALTNYRKTLELAPGGFFTAEVAVDTLTRESAGEFPSGLYEAFAMLEHMPRDQRAAIASQLVERVPSFAPGWNEHANFVADPAQRLDAIEKGLAARPDRLTRGLLTVKKAITMSSLGDTAGAMQLLQQVASGSSESDGTRAVTEFARARLSSAGAG
jgi:tetratricopeptide (TPR) repeat protein